MRGHGDRLECSVRVIGFDVLGEIDETDRGRLLSRFDAECDVDRLASRKEATLGVEGRGDGYLAQIEGSRRRAVACKDPEDEQENVRHAAILTGERYLLVNRQPLLLPLSVLFLPAKNLAPPMPFMSFKVMKSQMTSVPGTESMA